MYEKMIYTCTHTLQNYPHDEKLGQHNNLYSPRPRAQSGGYHHSWLG